MPNPFVDDTHSSPASDTVTRMDVEGTDGSDSEESKGDKLKPDTLDEEGKTPESEQIDVNDLNEGSQKKKVVSTPTPSQDGDAGHTQTVHRRAGIIRKAKKFKPTMRGHIVTFKIY